ncbi:PP2C family protein-serine/threonine phosphatase [Chimaeribacter arupi]|uniref:PP2C family protein-serine/threonine phosphatase n=1 Tax=Chimaeribacter arupi TaxID=2060066 RepID=UPI000C7CF4BC|nr:fused response regulator/phosphatase [Chimaeribacter arupi]PLR33505.1 response regulator [Chimaeribacter arupi]
MQSLSVEREPATILVVDDSSSYRLLLSSLLKKWGYRVFEAEQGEAALALMAQQPINMVISDWEMPVMDGPTLCRAIRSNTSTRYIYLILVTARHTVEDLTTGIEAGADDFLSKPVNAAELQARLYAGRRILDLEANLALRNAKLAQAWQQMEADLQAAARLQHSLLPARNFALQGFSIDWLFVPSAYVSGDMFNFFALSDHHIGFYCIDVAGHGVTAAMHSLAVALQFLHGRTVENFLARSGPDGGVIITPPHQVVSLLNQRFCYENDDVHSYFTMIYGVINTQTGEGSLCQAGHPTPFIVHPDGSTTSVGEGGGPVGLFEMLTWDECTFRLEEGECLYLYSDGISECENQESEQYGESRLKNVLAEHHRLPRAERFLQVELSLLAWRNVQLEVVDPQNGVKYGNSNLHDDVSLLVIERTSPFTRQEEQP